MNIYCHQYDVEARGETDKSPDTLGVSITLAASFGTELEQASGPALVSGPEGVAAQPPVRGKGPRAQHGEQPRAISSDAAEDSVAGDRVTPPAKNQSDSDPSEQNAPTSENQLDSVANSDAGSDAFASHPRKTTSGEMASVGRRVDALVIAHKLDVTPAWRDEFQERQAMADLAGAAQLQLGDLYFEIRRSRKPNCVAFQNADIRCAFDERGPGGWNLEVVTRATFLATHTIAQSIELSERIAKLLGQPVKTRLRRIDLCADFTGFHLSRDDAERILTRSKVEVFMPDSKDYDEASGEFCKPPLREHRRPNLVVTGFTVSPGNPLMARIYDKTGELTLAGREEKLAIEHTNWRGNLWDGASQVTRVEFQLRGEVLDELKLRDLQNLEGTLDGIWQTGVRWLRIVEPKSATRLSRCQLDSRWRAVTEVQFKHIAAPIKRVRVRGGATAEHAMGAVRSRLAGALKLTKVEFFTNDGEVIANEKAIANSLNQEQ